MRIRVHGVIRKTALNFTKRMLRFLYQSYRFQMSETYFVIYRVPRHQVCTIMMTAPRLDEHYPMK